MHIKINLNPNVHSYKQPILKILGSVILFLIVFSRSRLLPMVYDGGHPLLEHIMDILSIPVMLVILLIFEISLAEIIKVYGEKSKAKLAQDVANGNSSIKAKGYSIDEIIKLVAENDIIEISIVCNQTVIDIGSSSVWDVGEPKPHDKKYFINDESYYDIKQFELKLMSYLSNGKIKVIEIDHNRV